MPRFVIERDVPKAGAWNPKERQDVAKLSNGVLSGMGPSIHWEHSYVSGDKIYCVYVADSEELIRQHAKESGFPADKVSRVEFILDPVNAEG